MVRRVGYADSGCYVCLPRHYASGLLTPVNVGDEDDGTLSVIVTFITREGANIMPLVTKTVARWLLMAYTPLIIVVTLASARRGGYC